MKEHSDFSIPNADILIIHMIDEASVYYCANRNSEHYEYLLSFRAAL